MNLRHKNFRILFLILLIAPFCLAQAQTKMNASQILEKTIAGITSSKGSRAQFKIFNSGYSGSGTIMTSGNKFKVDLPDVKVWYNGKDLYTYNQRTNETTVVVPTAEELSESNPLAYVINAGKNYNATFSTVKKDGCYVLELTPKQKGNIKRITVTIHKSDFSLEKIVVEPSSGNPVRADISDFKTGLNIAGNEFEYPKTKFPKTEIIDLR